MFRRCIAAISLLLVLPCAQAAQALNFGIISTESTGALKKIWQPMLDDMEKKTGYTINAFFAPDYTGVIEGMRFNKVQLAWMGNKSAIEAIDRANGEIFAQQVDADGAPGYWSLLITHADSGINSVEQVLKAKDKYSLGFGDPQSTSGFLVPGYYLFTRNEVDPKTHFKNVRNANHETNLMAVLNKQVDVATNNTEIVDKLKLTNPEKAAQIRILWKSPLIPKDPLLWRKDLDAGVKAKIRQFFANYGKTAEEKAILKAIYNTGSFRASDNRQVLPIRQLELVKNKAKIQDDTTLSLEEKNAKVAEIDAKLAEISKQIAEK